MSRDLSMTKHSMMSLQDQIDFTNAELRTLVWKENRTMRGIITNPDAVLIKRAKRHFRRAQNGARQLDGSIRTFKNCVRRWDNDELYRTQLQREENLTREHMKEYDYLANLPRVEYKMSWEERQRRNQNHTWKLIQEKGGGSRTVQTSSYPTYQSLQEAKAHAPAPYHPSSSSTSWSRSDQWWSQSWQANTPPWKRDDDWGQKKW